MRSIFSRILTKLEWISKIREWPTPGMILAWALFMEGDMDGHGTDGDDENDADPAQIIIDAIDEITAHGSAGD